VSCGGDNQIDNESVPPKMPHGSDEHKRRQHLSTPIIIAAFGTSGKARAAYAKVDAHMKAIFPGHDIHWAYTSRIIRNHLKKRGIDVPSPADIITALAEEGHSWAVVQPLNMICGHEFYRLVNEVQNDHCRVSIGHALLCSQSDHRAVARAMAPIFSKDDCEAVVLVGHGTDHCIWSTYSAFYHRLRKVYGQRSYGAMIEEADPSRDSIIEKIKADGFRRVRLVPFMLVAGTHFEEDLAGLEDSWKTACEAQGLNVSLETEGLASRHPIVEIFGRHIKSALSVIPDSAPVEISKPVLSGVTG
jgi:sirohydrochlorin cobaltochelatase